MNYLQYFQKTLTTLAITATLVLLGISSSVASEQPALKIAIISDINGSYGSTSYSPHVHRALAMIIEQKPDLLLCLGDMVAGQSRKLNNDVIEAMWQGFAADVLKPVNEAGIDFAFTFGNHDAPAGRHFAHEREAAAKFWHKNRPNLAYINSQNYPFYYSFRHKGIFFISLFASSQTLSSEQRAWLAEQLKSNEAKTARFRIVLGHLPLYAVSQGRNKAGEIIADGAELYALLNGFGVDYYLSGHHHAFYAARNDHTIMIHSGALGGGPRKLIGSDQSPLRTFTMLSFDQHKSNPVITTYSLTKPPEVIEAKKLPPSIEGVTGVQFRFNWDQSGKNQ